MEKTIEQAEEEFQNWIKTLQISKERYYVSFDDQGNLIDISTLPGPKKLEIDEESAEDIYQGKKNLNSFKVDISTMSIVDNQTVSISLTKLDDVLHRVVEKQWSTVDDPDITIQYNASENSLTFLSNKKIKNYLWSGDTVLTFLITGYNDPNVLKEMIYVTVGDIIENQKTIKIEALENFSIYTRRVFKDYVFEVL
jgi:hypothetical protein